MSWPSAAHNCMIPCDLSTTGKAKSILLQINHFQYAINFFVRIDDQWKNQVNNYLEYHTNEIYDLLIQSKSTIKLSLQKLSSSRHVLELLNTPSTADTSDDGGGVGDDDGNGDEGDDDNDGQSGEDGENNQGELFNP